MARTCDHACDAYLVGELDDAAKAYRTADAALGRAKTAAQARIEAARKARTEARERLHAAIIDEAKRGTPPVEIVRRTGYSRDRVRVIMREGGIEPD